MFIFFSWIDIALLDPCWIWKTCYCKWGYVEKFSSNTCLEFSGAILYWNYQLRFDGVAQTVPYHMIVLHHVNVVFMIPRRSICSTPNAQFYQKQIDCGFLEGLISEKNSLLGPFVSYGASLNSTPLLLLFCPHYKAPLPCACLCHVKSFRLCCIVCSE